jgi:hypothetical protein
VSNEVEEYSLDDVKMVFAIVRESITVDLLTKKVAALLNKERDAARVAALKEASDVAMKAREDFGDEVCLHVANEILALTKMEGN